MPVEVDYLGEGASDDAIALRLIEFCDGVPGKPLGQRAGGAGKNGVDRRLAGLNAGVRYGNPTLVLRDLDTDAECPGTLVNQLLKVRDNRLLLRICVPTAEAWLMSDRSAYARFCGLPESEIRSEPEKQAQLKQLLLSRAKTRPACRLAKQLSKNQKTAIPDWRTIGAWQAEFARVHWDVHRSIETGAAPSLTRAVHRLRQVCGALA